jgi:hypothetical protein
MYFKAKMDTLSETYIIRKLLETGPKYEGIIKFLDFENILTLKRALLLRPKMTYITCQILYIFCYKLVDFQLHY